MNKLQFPLDVKSLYADRIYDNETARRRCYEKSPNLPFIEGFDGLGLNMSFRHLFMWLCVLLLVVLVVMLIMNESNKDYITLGVDSLTL